MEDDEVDAQMTKLARVALLVELCPRPLRRAVLHRGLAFMADDDPAADRRNFPGWHPRELVDGGGSWFGREQ